MLRTTKTKYAISLSGHLLSNIPYETPPNTTLNEKFDILKNSSTEEYPKLSFFMLGVNKVLKEGLEIGFDYREHSTLDGVVYNPIPIVFRKEEDDLLPNERSLYRLRRTEVIQNENYVCYYGKGMDEKSSEIRYLEITKEGNTNRLNTLSFDNPNLLNPNNREDLGSLCVFSNVVSISLTYNEISDMRNYINLVYGEGYYLSEIGLCSGVDIIHNDNLETIKSQTLFFIEINKLKEDWLSQTEISKKIELGGMEIG